jgi:hypothetical protein
MLDDTTTHDLAFLSLLGFTEEDIAKVQEIRRYLAELAAELQQLRQALVGPAEAMAQRLSAYQRPYVMVPQRPAAPSPAPSRPTARIGFRYPHDRGDG